MTKLAVSLLVCLFTVLYLDSALAIKPYPSSYSVNRLRSLHLRESSIQAQSPFDQAWINSWAAIGDSFSAGIGAGHAIKGSSNVQLNADCYQYSYGFPNLINSESNLGANSHRRFQYLACSGARVRDIINNQVPKLESPQMVTLTAGGNDADLASILNYCVYMWSTKWLWTCDWYNSVLGSSRDLINDKQYSQNMRDLLTAVKAKMQSPSSRIFWVGYTKYFDTSTKDCDAVTWSFTRNTGFRQYLTQDRRTKMNALVDLVNEKIKAACSDAGPQCVFVDPSADVDAIQGRYCEPGVNEKYWGGSPEGWDREETIYYEWSTTKDDDNDFDRGRDDVAKRANANTNYYLSNDTFEGAVANWIKLGKANNEIDEKAAHLPDGDITAQGILPDWLGRVFHPTKFGHEIYAKNVMDAVFKEQGKLMKQPATKIKFATCPAPTGPATYRGQKNRCYADGHDADQATFGLDAAYKAINAFCDKHMNTAVKPGSGSIVDRMENGEDSKSSILFRMTLGTTPVCQKHDNNGGRWTIPDCRFNFASAMNDCDTNSGNKNGGARTADCITYSIQGSKTGATSTNSKPVPASPGPGSASVELGQLTCATSTVPANDAAFWMTLDEAKDAINSFCTTRDKGVSFKSDGGTPLQARVSTGDHPISVSATWRPNDSCKALPPLDFSKSGAADTCKKRLEVVLNTCNPSKGDNKYWKGGGSFFRDCIIWEIKRERKAS